MGGAGVANPERWVDRAGGNSLGTAKVHQTGQVVEKGMKFSPHFVTGASRLFQCFILWLPYKANQYILQCAWNLNELLVSLKTVPPY